MGPLQSEQTAIPAIRESRAIKPRQYLIDNESEPLTDGRLRHRLDRLTDSIVAWLRLQYASITFSILTFHRVHN